MSKVGDDLLYWMSHVGEGSWDRFRRSAQEIGSDAFRDLARPLRIELGDLAHADFFVAGSRHWRVRPPLLAGLGPAAGYGAVLVGARTPASLERVVESALGVGCTVETPL